jgi:aminoglycoside N3'-acetyltransferase
MDQGYESLPIAGAVPQTVPMRGVDEIAADVAALGVAQGDLVFVHASLRRLGPVDGGAVGVVDAVERAVGPTGTVMMILGAANDWDWVNAHPESERAALLADAEPFDPTGTPVLPEVGVLAEVMRTMPGTVVNDHPEGRFAARGRLAGELLRDLPWDDYYGPGSALARFVDRGGRVLRLGANPDTVTVLHYAEYLADVPSTVRVRRHRKVLDPEGTRIVVVECLDDENGIVPDERQPDEDYFAVILREYLSTGRARSGTVGDAQAELIGAADIVAFGATWMGANLA